MTLRPDCLDLFKPCHDTRDEVCELIYALSKRGLHPAISINRQECVITQYANMSPSVSACEPFENNATREWRDIAESPGPILLYM